MPNNPQHLPTSSSLAPSASSPANLNAPGQQQQQYHQQQSQQYRQRPPPPPSISSSISSSSERPGGRPHRAVSFTPEATSRAAGTASLADFLRSTGPDAPPPPPLPVALPSASQPGANAGSVSRKGGSIFSLGRKKTSRPSSDTSGTGERPSTSGMSMAAGAQGVAGVRGVETVVTASGQTVNIIPYKPPHLPPLAGTNLDSLTPRSSTQQDPYRASSAGANPYAMSFPLDKTTTGFPTAGAQSGLQGGGGHGSPQRPGAGMQRTDSAPSDVNGPSSHGPESHAPTAYASSPPRAHVSRRPNTGGSEQPSASPPRPFGATAQDSPSISHPSPSRPPRSAPPRRPSTAPPADLAPSAPSRKAMSATPPPAAVLSATITTQQDPSSTSYSPHPAPLTIARADSPTDPVLAPPVVTASERPPELGRPLDVALVDTKLQEQISMLELLGHKVEEDKDGKVLVGRRVERRSIATQVGAPGLATLIAPRRSSAPAETVLSNAPSTQTGHVVVQTITTETPTTESGPRSVRMGSSSSGSGSRGPDSSPEFFTPTGSSDGAFVGSHSDESLHAPASTLVTASSSSSSTPLTSTTFSTTSTTPTSPASVNALTPRPTTKSLCPAGFPSQPAIPPRKSSTRPSTSPEMATRGVFGGEPHSMTPTQEEKDRERRIAYLEEKVRREVERRKDAEGAMKRLDRSTGEQKSRWEDMAGWALDVMERTERERTVLRTENAKLKREVELWKMRAQVAESGRLMDGHAAEEGSDQTHQSAGVQEKAGAQARTSTYDDDHHRGGESRASSGLWELA